MLNWCCKCCKKSRPKYQSTLKLLNKRYSLISSKKDEETDNDATLIPDFCVPGTSINRVQPRASEIYLVDAVKQLESPANSTIMKRRRSQSLSEKVFFSPRGSTDSLGKLQPSLYTYEETVESEPPISPPASSMLMPFSPSNEEIVYETFGTVFFTVLYENTANRLIIHVDKVLDLPSKGMNQTYDSFISASLLPGEHQRRSSNVVKQTLCPHFNEDFTFYLEQKELTRKTLRLSMNDFERPNLQDSIGHILLPLQEIKKSQGKKCFEMKLESRAEIHSDLGEIFVSLCYIPSQDKLCTLILRAKNLKSDHTVSGIYIKVTLNCGGEKVKSKKTDIVEPSANPTFSKMLNFIVPPYYLEDTNLVYSIWVRNFLKSDQILGRMTLGPYIYSQGEKLTHWGQMIKSQQSVVKGHKLYL